MKEHKGMRPQDICILFKIIAKGEDSWYNKDLAVELKISNSEISESLYRSMQGQLIDDDKRGVYRKNLMEFLSYGLKHVFPVIPGRLGRGTATAHSAPPLNEMISANEHYVWPDNKGKVRGLLVEPLYKTMPEAAKQDNHLYELLALADALRIGRAREQQMAIKELEKRIIHDEWSR
ncbi:MAG TPA: hypothetical protein VF181_01080 [Balneolaceae bacterium]